MSSQERFGYEWDKYTWMSPDYERQFRNWTHPLTPKDWEGARVLDAGCGMGRNSYWPMKYGASSVVSFDFDTRSISRAKETLKDFKQVEVLYKSIYDITWKNEFNIAFSIGVIHHLADPKAALARLVDALAPGGILLIWVYSYEGNEWIVRFVNPVRVHITSKLSPALVHFLSYFCSVPLFLLVKILRGPTPYLKQLSTFSFWHIHSIVFDQLIPDIANYWNRDEVRALTNGLFLRDVDVQPTPEGTGWILTARKHA